MPTPPRLGRYEILGPLGHGAMGAVYRATDPALDRTVAIKTINPALLVGGELRDEFLERFRREAKAAGRLSHPNIVSVFDLGLDEATATPFIVMEYVPGVSLEAVLKENPFLPLVQAMEIVEQVASALEEAHRHGIVHRDIKPANIFLDDRGRVKVGDFGIARLDGSELTQTGVRVGTPGYTAPEVLQGAIAGPRADIFALGVLAYRVFTGRRPFSGTLPEALAIDILQREPPSPRAVRPELPEGLSAGVMRALAKSPAERTPSALAFLQELRALVAVPGTPAPAPPTIATVDDSAAPAGMPTRTEPVQPRIRRGHRWLSTAALLAAALAVGACGYLVMRALSQQQAATLAPAPAPVTVAPATSPRRPSSAATRSVGSAPANRAPAAGDGASMDRARELAKDAEELWRDAQNKADRAQDNNKGQEKGRGRGKKDKDHKDDRH